MMKRKVPDGDGFKTEMHEMGYCISHQEMYDAAMKMCSLGIKPEFECFALSDLQYLNRLIGMGYQDPFGGPHWVQFVFGPNASWPTPEFILALKHHIPKNTMLGFIATGTSQFPILAQGLIIGAHVRVGMEDNVYLGKGQKAGSNAELVEKVMRMAGDLGRSVASCEEARKMFGLGAPRQYN